MRDFSKSVRRERAPLVVMVLLLAGAAMSGCGVGEAGDTPTSAPADTWTVTLNQSGGIMGMQRTMQLNSAGWLEVTDERLGTRATRMLTSDELQPIAALVVDVGAMQAEVLPPCADCFVYRLSIEKGRVRIEGLLNDVNLHESAVAALIEALVELGGEIMPR